MRWIACVGLVAALAGCGGPPVTKGEIKDRNAAFQAEQCAQGYIKRDNSGATNAEIWQMCAEASAQLAKRPVEGVKAQIVRQQKRDVFAM